MSVATGVLNMVNSVPSEVWEVLISALFVSPFALGIKKWFHIHREIVMLLWVMGAAFFTAALAYNANTPFLNPAVMIPLQGLVTFALSQPAYYLIFKPLRNKVRQAVADSAELNDDIRSAKVQ